MMEEACVRKRERRSESRWEEGPAAGKLALSYQTLDSYRLMRASETRRYDFLASVECQTFIVILYESV
jgi:hypothetical protein